MAPTISDTTAEQAHDVTFLELLRAEAQAQHALAMKRQTLRDMTDFRDPSLRYGWTKKPDPRSFEQVLADFTAIVEAGREGKFSTGYYCYGDQAAGHLATHAGLMQDLSDARRSAREHEANYTGWDRYWLVTSSPGHIHSSMGCSSCKVTTTYALVPSLSASTAEAAIEMFGPAMCTVCFPAAPTGLKVSKALAESVGTDKFDVMLAKHQAKAGLL